MRQNTATKTDRQVSSGVRRSHPIEQGARGARRGGGAAEELRQHGSHDPADRRQAFSVVVRGASYPCNIVRFLARFSNIYFISFFCVVSRFLEGNGLLKEMILKGVRGHVDR